MKIPEKITKGDSLSWNDDPTQDALGEELSPGNGWTLNYAIRGAAGSAGTLDLVATTEGDKWLTSITAVQTAALNVGLLYWQAFVTKASERRTIGSGRVEILANLALVTGVFDGRSQSEQDLDAVTEAIRALTSGGVQEYTIGTRTFRKMNLSDLLTMQSKLKFQVNQEKRSEKIKSGLGDPNNLYVRFR